MRLAAVAASMAVLGMLAAGCGGSSSNTADYRACKAMIKADLAKTLRSVSSGQLPQKLPTAAAASCTHLSHADMAKLMQQVSKELRSSPPTAASSAPAAASNLRFPARLLGLTKDTNPGDQAQLRTIARSDLVGGIHPQAAIYASSSSSVVVMGARLPPQQTQTGFINYLVTTVRKHDGAKDIRSFPPGPNAVALYCGHAPRLDATAIKCLWVEKLRFDEFIYLGRFASSLSETASKTSQIQAIIQP